MGRLIRPARTPPYRYANFPMQWVGGARICAADPAVEFILPLCDVTVTPTGTVSITWSIYFSTWTPGLAKTSTMRLRRTDLNGTVLASQAFGDPGQDSKAGLHQSWSSSYSDTTPTDGRYVMTLVETAAGSAAQFYTAALAFRLDGR